MAEEPASYQSMRSHADVHTFVVCYADVRRKGLWNGTGRGDVVKLRPDLRLALERDRYVLIDLPRSGV